MKQRLIVILLLMLALPFAVQALSGKGTTAAEFLKIGVGSRAVGMGEAYVAVANDPSAGYWNPAGLASMSVPTISAMHVFWLEDIYYDYLAGVLPLPIGMAGASLIYLNNGDIVRSDAGDTPDDPTRGIFTAADIAFTGSYGVAFSDKMKLGATMKFLSESIDAQASFGVALDLGFLYELPWEKIMLGVMIQNLGPSTKVDEEFFRMPLNFKIGTAYKPLSNIILSLDYNQLLEQEGKIALGAEYLYEELIALRLGYQYQGKLDQSELYTGFGTNSLAGISAGVGFYYSGFVLDYAFVPYGFLGSTHRVTLTYSMPQATPAPTAVPTLIPTATPVSKAVEVKALTERIEMIKEKMNKGVLKNILFKTGSADLLAVSKHTLNVIGEEFKKFPDLTIRIEGHTDSSGRTDDNLVLSQLRVETVKDYLVNNHGLNPHQLEAIGYGESKPITSNSTAFGRQRNRRVEFTILAEE